MSIMATMDIGIIGMAVMGTNLALNLADHGFKVAGYNHTPEAMDKFLATQPPKNFQGFYKLEEFLQALKRPRQIMLLIKAGEPVDMMIRQLTPLLEPGDIIMDGGNSFFKDTRRRHDVLAGKGINYFGIGLSGGESGARNGASIAVGGPRMVFPVVQPILEAVAARAGSPEEPCCTYVGADGSGHYVKMVHNGIEYADMELIAEVYLMLKYAGGLDNLQMSKIFHSWNEGGLHSYLIGITADILAEDDEEGGQLVDNILDSAVQTGTGRWTSIQALEQGVDVSLITAACDARLMSNIGDVRAKAAKLLQGPRYVQAADNVWVEKVRQSLYVGKIIAYAQGFSLFSSASKNFGWQLDLAKIAGIFRAGCNIQAIFLDKIMDAYTRNPALENMLLDEFFLQTINKYQQSLRQLNCQAVMLGIPIPAFANAMQYLDGYRSTHMGANLIQAQRDYFGAHTFERVDKPGIFHHKWQKHY